ncbi:hypothetical protein [Halosimplex pelagicum]|uniref:Uncharacterized protein n=1 Tax=Halosimplex pelagicum TaxID=869886 RepID=A0A7D5PFS0_9EURY|nr:hypothetical protein [Halosimplex pelagicum]QLH83640.1 hypothetical protein HZS54_19275 [Halosimplex pelagicum]
MAEVEKFKEMVESTEEDDLNEDTVELSYNEGKRLLEGTITASEETGDRAFETIRLNLIVLSILVATAGLTTTSFTSFAIGGAGISIIVSTLLAIYAYLSMSPAMSLNKDGVEDIQEEDSAIKAKEALAVAFSMWANDNFKKTQRRRRVLAFSFGLTMSAITIIGWSLYSTA